MGDGVFVGSGVSVGSGVFVGGGLSVGSGVFVGVFSPEPPPASEAISPGDNARLYTLTSSIVPLKGRLAAIGGLEPIQTGTEESMLMFPDFAICPT